jgi:hypothetical protein
MHRPRCLVVIGVLAVAVCMVAAGPAAAAKGGNNDTAKQCQKGGWQSLFSATGDGFVTQGDCVNDGAQGRDVFTTAGEAACKQIHGAFAGGARPTTLWVCEYLSPPNPIPPASPAVLQNACVIDGGVSLDAMSLSGDTVIGFCDTTTD